MSVNFEKVHEEKHVQASMRDGCVENSSSNRRKSEALRFFFRLSLIIPKCE